MRNNLRTRRQVVGMLGILAAGSVAGCFGNNGDGESTDDGDETEENGDESEEASEESPDPEDATDTVADFVESAADRDEETYEQLQHSDGPLVKDNEHQQISFPTGTVEQAELVDGDTETATVQATVLLTETDAENDFEFELRSDGMDWFLWDWEPITDVSTPAISPEVFIEEFFQVLEERDDDEAQAMVADEFGAGQTMVQEIVNAPEIALVSTEELESGDGVAEVEVTFSYVDGDGDEEEETEQWTLHVDDGQWVLAGF